MNKSKIEFGNNYSRWVKSGASRPYFDPSRYKEKLGIGFVYILAAIGIIGLWVRGLVTAMPGAFVSSSPVSVEEVKYIFDWSQYWAWFDGVAIGAFGVLLIAFVVWLILLVLHLSLYH